MARTGTSVQLLKAREFSCPVACLWFLVLGIGVPESIFYYAAKEDTIIVAGPRGSHRELARALEFYVDEGEVTGDAVSPRAVHHAIREGYLVGVRI